MAPTRRTTSIEWIRIIVTLSVIMHHFEGLYIGEDILFGDAAVVVDFFFMLSGFLLIKGVSSKQIDLDSMSLGESFVASLGYSYKKARSFYAAYLTAFALVFVLNMIVGKVTDIGVILKELFHYKWEILLLQMAGFNQSPQFNEDYLVGSAWYLSAMLITMIPVYFLVSHYAKAFMNFIAPVAVICIYGFMMQTYGTMDVGNEVVLGFILSGLLRAFAGLSVGCIVYGIYIRLKEFEKKDINGSGKRTHKLKLTAFNIMEICCYLSLPCIVLLTKWLEPSDMLFWVLIFAVLLLLGFMDETAVSKFLNSHFTSLGIYLGKLSLYIYLFHWFVVLVFRNYFPGMAYGKAAILYIAAIVVLSMIMMFIFEKIKGRSKA